MFLYRADYATVAMTMSAYLSVCPSQADALLKRLNYIPKQTVSCLNL